jgi:hypothetical protein
LAIGQNTNPSLAHFAAAAKKNPTTNPLPVVIFAVASQKDFTQTRPHVPGTNPQIEGGAICPPIVLLPVLPLKLQEIPRGKKGGGGRRRISKTDEFHDATWESHISTSICLSLLLS